MEPEQALPLAPPRWREVFSGKGGRLVAGLLLLEAIAAMEYLVIATIMPDIRRDLGMVQLYGLAFTAASLAMLAAVPIAGKEMDRFGPRRVLLQSLGLMAAGLVVCATAVSMPVLLIGQFVMGAGGGGLYSFSIGTVAKTFPERMRPRVLALFATMWILPGLAGPGLGALVASHLGWRWAFVALVPPLAVGYGLTAPAIDLMPPSEEVRTTLAPRWPLQLMVGAGILFSSLTVVSWFSPFAIAVGAAVAWPALRQIVVPGTLRARPGIPAAGAAAFLLSFGFIAVDTFLTLMLTRLRGLSLGMASLVLTAATITWSAGSTWQSGRTERISLPRLMELGAGFIFVGELGVFAVLWSSVPVWVAFAGWTSVGLGMGIAFPTPALATMQQAGDGQEGTQLSSVLLMDILGIASGAGLGGGAVALAKAMDVSISWGIGASYVMGLTALGLLMMIAHNMVSDRGVPLTPDPAPSAS